MREGLRRFLLGRASYGFSPLRPGAIERLRTDIGDVGIVRYLYDMYLAELASRVSSINEAVRIGDANALAFAGHTLKSTSALVGADSLAELCRELEAAGQAGDVARIAGELSRLNGEAKAVRRRLQALLASGAVGSLGPTTPAA